MRMHNPKCNIMTRHMAVFEIEAGLDTLFPAEYRTGEARYIRRAVLRSESYWHPDTEHVAVIYDRLPTAGAPG